MRLVLARLHMGLVLLIVLFIIINPLTYVASTTTHNNINKHFTIKAQADDNKEDNEENEGLEAESLGTAALAGGTLAVLAYIIPKYARTLLNIKLPPKYYKYSLDIHSYGTILAASLGIIHGYIYKAEATPLEYTMIALMIFLLASGALLRYAKNKRLKIAARLIHGQRLLAVILLALVLAHMSMKG